MKTDIHFVSHLAQFFSEWEMFQTKVVQKTKTHILCSLTFFRKSRRLWDNVEKYCRAGQDTDGNMAHAHCMLGTYGYKHTLTIYNFYCFSTTTMVARTRPIVTLYLHWPVLFMNRFGVEGFLWACAQNVLAYSYTWLNTAATIVIVWIVPLLLVPPRLAAKQFNIQGFLFVHHWSSYVAC